MKIEGYEEISEEEYHRLPQGEGASFNIVNDIHLHYFKKAQKFPIVFEDKEFEINILERGIQIETKQGANFLYFVYSKDFPLLVKAVEKAKEVIKKNEVKE